MNTLRTALVGCGKVGQIHAAALSSLAESTFVAVCTRTLCFLVVALCTRISAVGCSVNCIAKSLVFRSASGRPVLVIASGGNKVDETRLSAELGEPVERALGQLAGESEVLDPGFPEELSRWFRDWTSAGFFHSVQVPD